MGLKKDLVQLHNLNKELCHEKHMENLYGDKDGEMTSDEKYIVMMDLISEKGLKKIEIYEEDFKRINEKYDLRWTERDIKECVDRDKGDYTTYMLPLSYKLRKKVYVELYELYLKRNYGGR